VTLCIDPALVALSNMPVIEETISTINSKPLKTVKFAQTPIMSPYLFAVAVGDFEYVEGISKPKKPEGATAISCRTYTLKGQSHLGKFSVEVATKTLEFFSEFFGVAYPLPKMDMIAIPDFGAGAMENWGLVTYREVLLLYDPLKTSAHSKQRIAYVIG
jgi:aminopeptidase N